MGKMITQASTRNTHTTTTTTTIIFIRGECIHANLLFIISSPLALTPVVSTSGNGSVRGWTLHGNEFEAAFDSHFNTYWAQVWAVLSRCPWAFLFFARFALVLIWSSKLGAC